MRVQLIAFGKLKTAGLRNAADHYAKLFSGWVQLDEIELKPIAIPDKSEATRRLVQEREATVLLQKLGSTPFYILDEGGQAMRTQRWAALAREWESAGVSQIAFCVGSSLGFSPTVRAKARGILSLGPQTLSFELSRVVLLEQLYRSWSVVRGHPYHNEGA